MTTREQDGSRMHDCRYVVKIPRISQQNMTFDIGIHGDLKKVKNFIFYNLRRLTLHFYNSLKYKYSSV